LIIATALLFLGFVWAMGAPPPCSSSLWSSSPY
jgi:hypothetical protein